MPTVFLSHSTVDKPFVRQLADFLTQNAADNITVWLDEREIAPGQNIVAKIQQGLDSDFILLILSPDSVNSTWVKEEWTDAFWDQTNNQQTKLIGVLYRDCTIPRLLRNKKYLDLRNNHLDGFKALKSFLLTNQPIAPHQHVNQLPLRPPLFIGREPELAELRSRLAEKGVLVHICERPGQGKSTLALEFAHRYQSDFESVYWLPCNSGSLAAIAADLESRLALKLAKDTPELVHDLKQILSQKRCLLILDNVENEDPAQLIPGGVASVLVTTRLTNLRFLRSRQPLKVPLFTEDQCFELFRRELGVESVDAHQPECRALFNRLGHLPVAINLSAALIREDVRYTVTSIASNLPADITDLIRQAIAALGEQSRRLLSAMAACAPEGFSLNLAAKIAEFDEPPSLNALQQLVSRNLAEELSRDHRRYRLHTLIREVAEGQSFAAQHANAVNERFENWETNWRQCEQDLPDFQTAFTWALEHDNDATPNSRLGQLAYCGWALTSRIGRPSEALGICQKMAARCGRRRDDAILQIWLGNQALIHQAWGRFDEALALHKKKEEICLNLGNQNSLQRTYGNQAIILRNWSRLDEALALLKKQEELCLHLGNQDGLQVSYGNQALILKAWDRLDEALALHKKEEEICLHLGNQDGLQISYGNQANILRSWGRLDDALVLYKKQEQICLQLGSKYGLGHCYWSWGLLERALNHPDAEHEKLSAALALFTQLKMPRQRDAVQAELAKPRVAGQS